MSAPTPTPCLSGLESPENIGWETLANNHAAAWLVDQFCIEAFVTYAKLNHFWHVTNYLINSLLDEKFSIIYGTEDSLLYLQNPPPAPNLNHSLVSTVK